MFFYFSSLEIEYLDISKNGSLFPRNQFIDFNFLAPNFKIISSLHDIISSATIL